MKYLNTFEVKTTKEALEIAIIQKDKLSNLHTHGCIELTTAIIYLERFITVTAAVLEGEK